MADHTESAWRRHKDQRFHLAGGNFSVEPLGAMSEEGLFSLIVPVGLCNRTAAGAGRAMGTARFIGAEQMGREILLLIDLAHLEIGKLGIAGVLKHERLGAITHDHPFSVADQQFRHKPISSIARTEPYRTQDLGSCSGSNGEIFNSGSVRAVEEPAGNNLGLDLGSALKNIEDS